jgi:hypothetical protein
MERQEKCFETNARPMIKKKPIKKNHTSNHNNKNRKKYQKQKKNKKKIQNFK